MYKRTLYFFDNQKKAKCGYFHWVKFVIKDWVQMLKIGNFEETRKY